MNKAMIESYVRNAIGAVIGAVVTVMAVKSYGSPVDLSGADWKAVANALWAGALPTLARYLNKNDKAFGNTK
jgi:hypothetical protein